MPSKKDNDVPAVPSPQDNSDRHWTIKEAATYLGVSKWTIYGWVSTGKYSADPIPTVHLSSRCLRFPAEELKAWANRRRNGGKGGAL